MRNGFISIVPCNSQCGVIDISGEVVSNQVSRFCTPSPLPKSEVILSCRFEDLRQLLGSSFDLRTQPPECLQIGAAWSGEKTGEVEGDSAENADE